MSTLNVDTINGQNVHATGIVSAGSALKAPNYADSGKPSSADPGTVIYNTTGTDVEVWKGSSWLSLGAGNMRTWTTETRPSSPSLAQFGFNTDTSQAEIFNGSDWIAFGSAAGGEGSGPLFNFTTFTFKSIVGRGEDEGPSFSQMQSEYSGQPWNDGTHFAQGDHQGYQKWTVPEDGNYEIEAGGARGGRDLNYGQYNIWGAKIKGTFALTQSDQIEMAVGVGGNQYYCPHGNECGGGGGSFVKNKTTNTLLIAAGGGGGSMGGNYGWSCGRPTSHCEGRSGEYGGRYGCYCQPSQPTAGYGGNVCGSYTGHAGGGYQGDGTSQYSGHCGNGRGGKGYNNGLQGGRGDHCYAPSSGTGNQGGFGGGGGGNLTSPGAAGGWTGGCCSGNWSSYGVCGGGGGSYNSGTSQQNTQGGNSGTEGGQYQGNGYIKITKT